MRSTERADESGRTDGRARPGRKLDRSRDAVILDAALEILAESGYDGMTVDLVAARAKAARATVYRRWATKAELAVDAVARLSRDDAGQEELPDTGNLRDDLIATIRPHTIEDQQFRVQVLAGLLSLSNTDHPLAGAAAAGAGPWIEVGRTLLQRAVDRGEFPPADVDTLAQVVPMMCICRAVQQQPITREFSLALIDGVLLPAMRGGVDRSLPG